MGTTLDAITAGSVRLQVTAVIEGFSYVLTDGDPAAVFAAYAASSTVPLSDDFINAIGGLSVQWDMEQRASPWKPFIDPAIIKLAVVPAEAVVNGVSAGISDIVGQTVFKRTGGTESHLTAAIDCDDASVVVQRSDDFAASGEIFLGPETIAYTTNTIASETFSTLTRGKYPAAFTSSGGRWARPHAPTTVTVPAQNVALNPIVSSEPRTWIGRWVAVWLHNVSGTTWDSPESDGSAAHLAFAGQIVGVEDVDGATVFTCEDLRRKINETVLMRDQFKARIQEGVRLETGWRFKCVTARNTGTLSVGTANDLVVKSAGATGANEVDAGVYTASELGNIFNEWLQSEKLATRILFNLRYEALADAQDGTRGRLYLNDSTTTSAVRQVSVYGTDSRAFRFLGWQSGSIVIDSGGGATLSVTGDTAPVRAWIWDVASGGTRIALDQPRGTWISQETLLPPALRDVNTTYDGIMRIGSLGYLRVGRISDTSFRATSSNMGAFFAGNALRPFVTVDDEADLNVEQVLLITGKFKDVLLKLLFSTGTSGFNDATYDVVGESLGCAIPYSFAGADFVTEVGNLACADLDLTALIRKPTRFAEQFESDFVLRRCFFTWGQGRLRVGTWATPTSTYASTTLDETTKGAPFGTRDKQRAQTREDGNFYNVVKIKYNQNADGEYADEVMLADASSIRDHGERSLTINARNTFSGRGNNGAALDELVAVFAGYFTFTSRPWLVVRRSIDHTKFESTIPGTVLSLTDKHVRSPATGLRYSNQTATGGVSGVPGMVIGHRYDWGGTEAGIDGGAPVTRKLGGEVDVMISPRRTIAAYAPTAQVDEGAANAGYDAGTKTLTLHAHKFSESSESVDAANFAVGDFVIVHEIDPDDPAVYDLHQDEVAAQSGNTITLGNDINGSFQWDATKRYRVTYDVYGGCTAAQQAKCFQSDDDDGLVANTVQSYGYGYFGGAQGTVNPTALAATEAPARYATVAYGDGSAFDVGFDFDAVRLANNALNYKTAPQQPTAYASSEVRGFSGGGTRQVVEMQPIFLGMGGLGWQSRYVYVAPRFRSTTGATARCYVSLCRLRPVGSTRDDVTFLDPYATKTFTTTSTTFAIATAQTIDISLLRLAVGSNGGWGWLIVEIETATEYTGVGRGYLGPLVAI